MFFRFSLLPLKKSLVSDATCLPGTLISCLLLPIYLYLQDSVVPHSTNNPWT